MLHFLRQTRKTIAQLDDELSEGLLVLVRLVLLVVACCRQRMEVKIKPPHEG